MPNRPLHFAANLTWACQMRCRICWLDKLGIDRATPTMDWQQWRDALARYGANLLVDFSGGEPLLYPGFHRLCLALSAANVEWAVTSNMRELAVARQFIQMPVANCLSWNMSWHHGVSPESLEVLRQMQAAGYHVALNVVLHPGEPLPDARVSAGLPISWIPYQNWEEGDGTDGIPRLCNAGRQHAVATPDGKLYRCLVEFQKGRPPMGNLTTGELQAVPSTFLCRIGCSTCYTGNWQAAAGWGIQMEVAQ